MALYIATTTDTTPVIVNAITGAIMQTRNGRGGRRTVRLYYGGRSHSHTFAHAWQCLRLGYNLQDCKRLHVHHIDGDRLNDTPANYTAICANMHRAMHRIR